MTLQDYRREQSRQILARRLPELRRDYWQRKAWKDCGPGGHYPDASA